MQRIYALPKDIPEDEKERQDAITDALLHGGDVDAVLRSGQAQAWYCRLEAPKASNSLELYDFTI